MEAIRMLIVDDHDIVRRGLTTAFESQANFLVVGETSSAEQAMVMARQLKPTVVLTDLKMKGMNGIELARILREELPDIKVAVLTAYDDERDLKEAVVAGVVGYLLKDTHLGDLATLIRTMVAVDGVFLTNSVRAGKQICSSSSEPRTVLPDGDQPSLAGLTPREQEIYRLMAENCSNKEIACKLHIAEPTVKTHVSRILNKLNQPNRAQAVIYGVKRGMSLIS